MENTTIEQAMKIVTEEIKNDPGYRVGWQANIAMAFKDEYEKHVEKYGTLNLNIHEIANNAADNFLNLLTS